MIPTVPSPDATPGRPRSSPAPGTDPRDAGRARLVRGLGAAALLGLVAACGGGGGESPAPVTAPTLIIRSAATGEVRAAFDVQFFFSAPVRFPSGTLPFSLSGARQQPGSFVQLTPDTWQVTLVPNADAQGLVDLRVPPGAFTDETGAASNAAAYEFAQPFNTLTPLATLDFAGPVGAFGAITGPGMFTLRFGAVLDAPLAADRLQLTAGTIGNFRRLSAPGQNDVYTFDFTPPPATRGGFTIELPARAVTSGGIGNARNWWTFALAIP